jgi:hypothetical protein
MRLPKLSHILACREGVGIEGRGMHGHGKLEPDDGFAAGVVSIEAQEHAGNAGEPFRAGRGAIEGHHVGHATRQAGGRVKWALNDHKRHAGRSRLGNCGAIHKRFLVAVTIAQIEVFRARGAVEGPAGAPGQLPGRVGVGDEKRART